MATTPSNGAPLRIAVAEDEAEIRQFLKECLSRAGHTVVEAGNGEQLVGLCKSQRPDLIVADIRMPGLDGLRAPAQVTRDGPPIPVVLVTSHPQDDIHSDEADYVMACLSKPVKPADLLASVELATRRHRQLLKVAAEAASWKQALEDRKAIERAKGAVMKRLGLEEEEPYRRLQRVASERNLKLVDVAKLVEKADEAYKQLEKAM